VEHCCPLCLCHSTDMSLGSGADPAAQERPPGLLLQMHTRPPDGGALFCVHANLFELYCLIRKDIFKPPLWETL
jgi:hypothetical protein